MAAGGGASKDPRSASADAIQVRPWPNAMTDAELVEAYGKASMSGDPNAHAMHAEILARLQRSGAPAPYVQHTPKVVL